MILRANRNHDGTLWTLVNYSVRLVHQQGLLVGLDSESQVVLSVILPIEIDNR